MGIAIRGIDSGAAAFLPSVWLIVRRGRPDPRRHRHPRPARQPGLC